MINVDPRKLTKRKCSPHENLEVASVDIADPISEADVQDTLPETSSSAQFALESISDTTVQIKRTRMGGSTENVYLATAYEIPDMLPSPQVDADTGFNSASQSCSEIKQVPESESEKEKGSEDEPRATYLFDHELREQGEQHPEKTDQAAECSFPLSKVTMNENVQFDEIKVNSPPDEDVISHPIVPDSPAQLEAFLPKPLQAKRKKLLVLDINGLLADIVSPIPKDFKSDANIARRAIFKRPSCSEFLMFCFETFEVGIWSSRTQKNVERVINFLLGDLKDRLLFCWDVTQCTSTGFSSLENRHKTLMFKEIRKLWEPQDHNLPWENKHFNESNTLLVDDSPYKALLNPLHTAIFPQSYNYRDRSDTSLGLHGEIRSYLEGLAAADHVQQYVEQHPFGQGAISQASPSWDFYYKAVISLFILQTPTT
ncbi:unnamed protein product [Rhodiola kirilowii]